MNAEQVDLDAALVAEVSARAAAIRERLAAAGSDAEIVAVTKRHPASVPLAALAAGLVDLGENYVQELLAKAAVVGPAAAALGLPAPRWHLIGGLQTNKVRLLGSVVHTVQTVDRPSLVAELARRSPGQRVLVQLDLAGSEGRSGCASDDVDELVDAAQRAGLDVVGLMGVAAPRATVGDAEVGAQFRRLTVAADRLGLEVRSMGMTDDLDLAVAAGSTMVRLGTALFGVRAT